MFQLDSKCVLLLIIDLGHAATVLPFAVGLQSKFGLPKKFKLNGQSEYQQPNLVSILSQLHPKKLQWQKLLPNTFSQQQDCAGLIWLDIIPINVTTIRSKQNEFDIANAQ